MKSVTFVTIENKTRVEPPAVCKRGTIPLARRVPQAGRVPLAGHGQNGTILQPKIRRQAVRTSPPPPPPPPPNFSNKINNFGNFLVNELA